MTSEADRDKEIEEASKVSNEKIKKIEEAQSKIKDMSADLKTANFHLESSIENEKLFSGYLIEAGHQAARSLTEEEWNRFRTVKKESSDQMATIDAILSALNQSKPMVGSVSIMSYSSSSAGVSINYVTRSVFSSPEILKGLAKSLRPINDTLTSQISSIESMLSGIDVDIAKKLVETCKSWNASAPSDRPELLLTLQSAVFSQLFEARYAVESNYARTPWFPSSPKKTMRFAEPKFFMIGNTEESKIDSISLGQINKVATDFEANFHDLSEYGKNGSNPIDAERAYRTTIRLLNECLMFRKIWHKASS
jgi:hypothetical protein